MSAVCTQCPRPSPDAFGCPRCVSELRQMLTDLPGWLAALREEINGETRKGTSVRRSTDKGSPALCRLGKYGSFRGSPGQQLVYTHSVLVEWTRDICEQRGVMFAPNTVGWNFIGPLILEWHRLPADYDSPDNLCKWLARHVTAIAADQSFAVAYREIKQIIGDIERIVDLPHEQRLCGRCPSLVTDNYGERVCNTRLMTPTDSSSVQCPACKSTHNVEQLWEQQRVEADGHSFTVAELDRMVLPAMRLSVPLRTLQHWAASSRLVPTGYDSTGEPRFLLADVRDLHAAKPQKLPTGGAAEKRRKAG